MNIHHKTAAALGTLLIAAATALPAHSKVAERYVIHDEPYAYASDECGFEIEVTGEFDDAAVVREGRGEDDRTFPVVSRWGYAERWTNPATGAWFTIKARTTFVEIDVTHVEGNIFRFEFIEAGQPLVIRDSEGDLVARNRGSVHASYLFDVGDDDLPGGEPVEEEGAFELINIAGPHPSWDDDICDIATDLIG